MNWTLGFIVIAYLAGIICGAGINKVVKQLQGDVKITEDEYRIIVNKINNDATIASDLKTTLLNQLHEYTSRIGIEAETLHIALQGIIKEVKGL